MGVTVQGRSKVTGDHVYVRRRRGYTHHGIDCGDGTVIHYSGEPGRPGEIRQSALEEFLVGGRLQTRHYRHRHSPTKTLRLARSRLGEQSYSLVFNNCEHFAEWCVTGTPRSVQVEEVGDALAWAGEAWLAYTPARAFARLLPQLARNPRPVATSIREN